MADRKMVWTSYMTELLLTCLGVLITAPFHLLWLVVDAAGPLRRKYDFESRLSSVKCKVIDAQEQLYVRRRLQTAEAHFRILIELNNIEVGSTARLNKDSRSCLRRRLRLHSADRNTLGGSQGENVDDLYQADRPTTASADYIRQRSGRSESNRGSSLSIQNVLATVAEFDSSPET